MFLLPLKALVNDKLRHFNQVYGTFGLRTICATGDSTVDDMLPLMRGRSIKSLLLSRWSVMRSILTGIGIAL